MGCDIHLVLERRSGRKWIAVNTFTPHYKANPRPNDVMFGFSSPAACDRNYARFAALAGVRGEGPKPLGLPEDGVSDTTEILLSEWASDGHSHSWLPLRAAAKIFADTEIVRSKKFSEFVTTFPMSYFFQVDRSDGSGKDADDFRIVFWFDN